MGESKWVLCRHVFHNLGLELGTLTVDLLALMVSYQVAQYVAWKPDPYSIATDAMSIPWTQGHFCLIPHILSKIKQGQVHTVTLITPCWQTQLQYPQLLGILIRRPILIPSSTTLLVNPKGNPHPLVLNKTLKLVAWHVSGRNYLSRELLRKQPSLLPSVEGRRLW